MIRNRIVVIAPGATVEQQNAITQYFRKPEYAFWHYGSEVWLVSSTSAQLLPVALRDALMAIVPGAYLIVLRVEPHPTMQDWATYHFPATAEWLRQSWD